MQFIAETTKIKQINANLEVKMGFS